MLHFEMLNIDVREIICIFALQNMKMTTTYVREPEQ